MGAFVEEDLVGEGAGVACYGEGSGADGGAHAEGGVLYDHGLIGTHAGLMHGHEVWLGVGLAIGDIEACDHEVGMEDAGVVAVEAREEAVLGAAGDEDDLESVGTDLLEEGKGAGHGQCLGQLVVILALTGIDALDLLMGGGTSPMLACEDVDGGETGSALMHEHIVARDA